MSTRRQFAQLDLFESITEHESFATKRMFGGLALYCHGKMVAALFEGDDSHTWRGQHFPFALWNGVLIPTEREYQESLMAILSGAAPHPVLGKWLYLPMSNDHFESSLDTLCRLIRKNDLRVGIFPKPRGKKKRLRR